MNPSTRYSIVSRQTKAEGRHGKEPITKGHSSAASASCSLKAAEQLPGLHGDALVLLCWVSGGQNVTTGFRHTKY